MKTLKTKEELAAQTEFSVLDIVTLFTVHGAHWIDDNKNPLDNFGHVTECRMVVEVGQEVPGEYSGYQFKPADGIGIATTQNGIRGIVPAVLLGCTDGQVIFY